MLLRRVVRSRRWLRWEVLGVAGAVGLFAGISALYALSDPPFRPRDEQAHLAYAHAIARGQLPEIDTPGRVPDAATEWQTQYDNNPDDRYRQVWVANHPPLNYVLLTPSVWLSNGLERPDGGLLFARLTNIALASAGLVFTYLFTYELTGGSRRMGVLATAMVALLPNPQVFYAGALNDGLGFATMTLLLWAAARYLRGGHSPRTLALLSAAVALAAASRATGLLVAVAVVTVVLGYRLAGASGPLANRLRATAFTGAVALAPAAVLSGWFYVRNIVLYGDIGASSFLMDRFSREPRGSFSEFMFDHQWWSWLYTSIATRPFGLDIMEVGRRVELVVVVAAIGLMLALLIPRLRSLRHRPPAGPAASGPFVPAVALALAATAALMVAMAQHVSSGGLPHLRYLYPSLGALAALVVVGLDRLVPRVLPLAVVIAQAVLLAGLVGPTAGELRAQVTLMPEGLDFVPSTSATRSLGVTLALLGACMLAAALAWSLVAPLARARAARRHVQRPQGDGQATEDQAGRPVEGREQAPDLAR
jgi:hypothetical protein